MQSVVSRKDPVNKEEFLERLLGELKNDNASVLREFEEFQARETVFFDKVEIAHEFLDLLTLKIKESKCTMDKSELSRFSLDFIRRTIKEYGYNPKFVATQCKALITYYQNQKELDKAIEVCEFLIRNGITDDDSKGFHVRLDELYRLKKKWDEKGQDAGFLPIPMDDDED